MKLADVNNFIDVYALDELPPITTNQSMIINLDSSNRPGTHWVCLYSTDDTVYYYDSFGVFPPPEIEHITRMSGLNRIYSSNRTQYEQGVLCGYYVCNFIIQMYKGVEPYDILYAFDNNNSLHNDLLLINNLKKLLL